MRRILCPRASGVLCALGLAAAAPRRDAARTVMLAGESLSAERLASERAALLGRAERALGQPPARVALSYELRYRGQSFELPVAEEHSAPPDPHALRETFAQAHERRYGYRDEHAEIELVTLRASAWGAAPRQPITATAGAPPPTPPPPPMRRVILDGQELEAQFLIGELATGTALRGPAICALGESTLLIPPGWEGTVDEHGTVRLHDVERPPDGERPHEAAPARGGGGSRGGGDARGGGGGGAR